MSGRRSMVRPATCRAARCSPQATVRPHD
ncbi:MAG: hypothetical protein JWP17_2451, partial [Solirubrobacterales bacterium]|nr:hypothetical protein [Solirubrobacterales bacterium]